MWPALLLTLALSADGLLVGFSYGARGIGIPAKSMAIIALCTGAGMSLSMSLGGIAVGLVPPQLTHYLGGGVLVLLGIWQLWQGVYKEKMAQRTQTNEHRLLARWRVQPLGIVVEILQEPMAADRDASGEIDPAEAVALGVVLGLDTLVAGFAASLAGFGLLLVVLVTLGLVFLTWCGLLLGHMGGKRLLGSYSAIIPAAILILVGLWEIGSIRTKGATVASGFVMYGCRRKSIPLQVCPKTSGCNM